MSHSFSFLDQWFHWKIWFSLVQSHSHVQIFATPWTTAHQSSPSFQELVMYGETWRAAVHGVAKSWTWLSNWTELNWTCPLSQWCHPTITSSVILFSSCLQSFPASGSFPMSQFFTSGGVSISPSMNIQGWFPLGWTCWISLQSKGLSRVSSNTTVQKHQFFSAQLSL